MWNSKFKLIYSSHNNTARVKKSTELLYLKLVNLEIHILLFYANY